MVGRTTCAPSVCVARLSFAPQVSRHPRGSDQGRSTPCGARTRRDGVPCGRVGAGFGRRARRADRRRRRTNDRRRTVFPERDARTLRRPGRTSRTSLPLPGSRPVPRTRAPPRGRVGARPGPHGSHDGNGETGHCLRPCAATTTERSGAIPRGEPLPEARHRNRSADPARTTRGRGVCPRGPGRSTRRIFRARWRGRPLPRLRSAADSPRVHWRHHRIRPTVRRGHTTFAQGTRCDHAEPPARLVAQTRLRRQRRSRPGW